MSKPTFDIERVEQALRQAARTARDGTRDQRSGKFLGEQAAVESAVAGLRRKEGAARG